MASDSAPDDEQRAAFVDADLHGARFVRTDLSGAVMRAVDLAGADLDAPWLLDGESSLWVNGVDVAPLVDAELDRRFPGRAQRRASDPDGLRAAWAAVERQWAATLARVEEMPPGTVDVCVDGEWSFAQTLRHLVMATDTWLGRAVLGVEQPYHPIGQPNAEYATDGHDLSVFSAVAPSWAEVLEVRAAHVAQVRDLLADVTDAELDVSAPTRGLRSTTRPSAPACTRSSRRSGSTSGMPRATSTRSGPGTGRVEPRPPQPRSAQFRSAQPSAALAARSSSRAARA